MVLQRGQPLPIWGWAVAGDEITVSIADQKASAKAGSDRRWTVLSDQARLHPGNTPLEMTIEAPPATC